MSEHRSLQRWGWSDREEQAWAERARTVSAPGTPGRVLSEHKGGLFVATSHGERHAVVPGRMRRAAREQGAPLPAVGDWVALTSHQGHGPVSVDAVLPRRTVLVRKAAGERELPQTLAANVDLVLLVAALNGERNARRLERALTVVRESGAEALVVLTKADLVPDPHAAVAELRAALQGAPALAVSARTGLGLPELEAELRPGRTAVLLGLSGVGKSTLVNLWVGAQKLAIGELDAEGKGRHTTTHRELVPLPGGALVIDTPGLRELGLWESEEGLREAFADLEELAQKCRFGNCGHDTEPGCALRAAAETGELPQGRLESFLKLQSELSASERRRNERERAEARRSYNALQRRMNEPNRRRK